LEEVSTVSNNDSRQSADDADPLTDKKHGNKIRRSRVLMVDRGKCNAVAAARQTPPSSRRGTLPHLDEAIKFGAPAASGPQWPAG